MPARSSQTAVRLPETQLRDASRSPAEDLVFIASLLSFEKHLQRYVGSDGTKSLAEPSLELILFAAAHISEKSPGRPRQKGQAELQPNSYQAAPWAAEPASRAASTSRRVPGHAGCCPSITREASTRFSSHSPKNDAVTPQTLRGRGRGRCRPTRGLAPTIAARPDASPRPPAAAAPRPATRSKRPPLAPRLQPQHPNRGALPVAARRGNAAVVLRSPRRPGQPRAARSRHHHSDSG